MKTTIIALAALVSMQAEAAQRITVFVQNGAAVPGQTLSRAEGLAGQMFARAGVRLSWRMGRPIGESISVGISEVSSGADHPGALAFARPYEGVHITVFYDRIRKSSPPDLTTNLLAHVLVHEITHVLQGVDRHSETGVMKAHWTVDDYAQMRAKPLPFTDWDVELIHKGFKFREAHLAVGDNVAEIASSERF